MLQKSGVGNTTVYNQVQNQLSTVGSQWSNALNILMLVVIIIALGVIIRELRGWGGLAGGA
jgi:preprotein translocase subunit SecF